MSVGVGITACQGVLTAGTRPGFGPDAQVAPHAYGHSTSVGSVASGHVGNYSTVAARLEASNSATRASRVRIYAWRATGFAPTHACPPPLLLSPADNHDAVSGAKNLAQALPLQWVLSKKAHQERRTQTTHRSWMTDSETFRPVRQGEPEGRLRWRRDILSEDRGSFAESPHGGVDRGPFGITWRW